MKRQIFNFVLINLLIFQGIGLMKNCIAADIQSGSITVLVKQLRNDNGEVRVALYNSSQGFPDQRDLACKVIPTRILGKEARVAFSEIPYGAYAISILHDENMNGKMDTNFLGIPKEGCGSSNNPNLKLKKPKYKECMFHLEEKELTTEINMYY